MTRCQRSHFEARCEARGYSVAEASACIVVDEGDWITVDRHHPAFPSGVRPGFTPVPIARKAANFAKAAVRHIADGGRQCTNEEIAARFAICEQCPLLVDAHCTHESCGCGISPKRAVLSKLTWASESCPIGKWGAT